MEKRGDPVPGSMFYRDFCAGCQEPMRVTEDRLKTSNYCGQCSTKPHFGGRTIRLGSADRSFHGGQYDKGEW